MAFERIFKAQFDSSINNALSTGVKGAFVEGCTYGVASGFITSIYFTEALLYRFGSLLVTKHLLLYWHGGTLLGAIGTGFVMFWDWESGEIFRWIDVEATNVGFLRFVSRVQFDSTFLCLGFPVLVRYWPSQLKTLSTSFGLIEIPTTQK